MAAFEPCDYIFLLGSRRSGTTWLGNIVDSHEEVFYFNEPFENGLGIFDALPGDSIYVAPDDPAYSEGLVSGLDQLQRYKSILPHVVARLAGVQLSEAILANTASSVLARLRLPYDYFRTYRAINQRQMRGFRHLIHTKSRHIRRYTVKETRLSSKIDAVRSALPGVKTVLLVRHPCGVVNSALRWLGRGYLRELRESLETFAGKIRRQKFFDQYVGLLDRYGYDSGQLHEKLAVYWRINNEILFDRIKGRPDSLLVVYENLCTNTLQSVRDVFGLIGLPVSDEVINFTLKSSTTRSANRGIVSTLRVSVEEFKSWQSLLHPSVRRDVEHIVQGSRLMNLFVGYYD